QDRAGLPGAEERGRGLGRRREQHRDAIALLDPVRAPHVGEAVGLLLQLAPQRLAHGPVEVLVDHRELVGRVLVADVLGDVVTLGDAPLVRGHGLLVSHPWEHMPAQRLRVSTDGGRRRMADPESMTKTSSSPLGFARMTGSSIAGRDAAAWVTDFLNAAYYRRAAEEREVDDLRLAFCILTTYWHRNGKLHLHDLAALHRAFGQARVESLRERDRGALLAGGAKLLGDWFPSAYKPRRGWGIAFETDNERENHVPERRLELAKLGPLTPESAPPSEQVWL